MKAKVIRTGEIVDVEFIKQQQYICNINVYKASDGREFDNSDLEFKTDIDWEQRRFELIKAAVQGLSSVNDEHGGWLVEEIRDISINIADAVITKLKEE